MLRFFWMKPHELLDLAILRAARARAQAEEARVMMCAYMRILAAVDPQTDWWRFAELKQKANDASEDYGKLMTRADEAQSAVDALITEDCN